MQAMNDKVYSKQPSYSQVAQSANRQKSMDKPTSSKTINQSVVNNKVNVTQDYTSNANNGGSQSRERQQKY